jgi:hypothetical protein
LLRHACDRSCKGSVCCGSSRLRRDWNYCLVRGTKHREQELCSNVIGLAEVIASNLSVPIAKLANLMTERRGHNFRRQDRTRCVVRSMPIPEPCAATTSWSLPKFACISHCALHFPTRRADLGTLKKGTRKILVRRINLTFDNDPAICFRSQYEEC